ncbi:MAG: hypothetical protein ACRBFS_13250 [Aureispira sp.]
MRLMLVMQLVALIILMVLTYFYWHIFRINLQNIEINAFDFEVYSAPSRSFGWRSFIVTVWSVFVGIKIRQRAHLSLLGILMITLGGVFSMLSLVLIFLPRVLTIADVYFYWHFYGLAMLGMTILAFLFYERAPNLEEAVEYDDVLDYFEENQKEN